MCSCKNTCLIRHVYTCRCNKLINFYNAFTNHICISTSEESLLNFILKVKKFQSYWHLSPVPLSTLASIDMQAIMDNLCFLPQNLWIIIHMTLSISPFDHDCIKSINIDHLSVYTVLEDWDIS